MLKRCSCILLACILLAGCGNEAVPSSAGLPLDQVESIYLQSQETVAETLSVDFSNAKEKAGGMLELEETCKLLDRDAVISMEFVNDRLVNLLYTLLYDDADRDNLKDGYEGLMALYKLTCEAFGEPGMEQTEYPDFEALYPNFESFMEESPVLMGTVWEAKQVDENALLYLNVVCGEDQMSVTWRVCQMRGTV